MSTLSKTLTVAAVTLTAFGTASAVNANEHETIVVQAGDTLSQISEKHFGSAAYVEEIAHVNKIENVNLINVGQELTLEGVKELGENGVQVPVVYQQNVATATYQAPAVYTTPTYDAPVAQAIPYQSTQAGSIVLANGNTAGEVGMYAAQQMEARTGVPASTWEHIIARESNGNPNAYNPSGAAGLFQSMPGWGSTATVEDQINAAERAYNAQGLSAWGY